MENNNVGLTIGVDETDIAYYAVGPEEANNTIYGNNFIGNTQQAQHSNIYGYNFLDNGSMGNYWSDYTTKYPNAVEIDHTGIGDTQYVIDANNTDRYPLMAPFNISNVTVQLPEWAAITPTPPTSPSPTPSQSTPIPTVSPTASPTPTTTPSSPTATQHYAIELSAHGKQQFKLAGKRGLDSRSSCHRGGRADSCRSNLKEKT